MSVLVGICLACGVHGVHAGGGSGKHGGEVVLRLLERSFVAMDTVVNVRLWIPPQVDGERAEALLCDLERHAAELEAELGPQGGGCGSLAELNSAPVGRPVRVGVAVAAVWSRAVEFWRQTGGTFNPCLGALEAAWHLASDSPSWRPPPHHLVARLCRSADPGLVRFREGDGTMLRTKPAVVVDFGGIAKGYVVDVLCEDLRRALEGVGGWRALVDAGGDVRVLGRKEGDTPWLIGIRHPMRRNRLLGVLELAPSKAVATSGAYERYRVWRGRRFHHIFDPWEGEPVAGEFDSVTVTAGDLLSADALATAVFVGGRATAAAVSRARTGVGMILWSERSGFLVVGAARGRFTPCVEGGVRTLPAPR